jgi:hypothetical protein
MSFHTGVTLVCATEEGLFARCRPIDFKELSIRSISDHGEERSVRVPLSHSALLEEAAKGVRMKTIHSSVSA